ncbi:MAG: endospore germination permease [Clostridiales bacterium]|nr:endospore germination permease [Clostridiales bacterium]
MKHKIVFGSFEATCITIILITTQLFLNYPRIMMETAWTAAWILSLYISLVALILFVIIVKLYENFEGKDLIDLGEFVAGKAGRIIVGMIIMGFLLYITPVILREFSENIKIIGLPHSPLSFVLMFFILGMIAASYMGLEPIVRVSAIIVPVVAVGYLLIIAGSSRYFDISRITPWLGSGPYEIFIKGLPRISVFAGVLLVYLLYPFIRTKKNFKTVGYLSILFASFFFFIGVLAFSLIFQYPTGTESFLPIYQLARLVEFGRFFQRIESVFIIFWVASALLHLSILLFLTAYVFKKTFQLKYYRPLILPFALMVYTMAFFPHNLPSAIKLESYFRYFAWMITFLLPIVLLILANAIKKLKKNEEANE